MDKLESLRAFIRVVEAGGFAAAAREMGGSRSAVAKLVARLERALGTQLLVRSTRRVRPTEAGLAFYERGQTVLAELEEAEQAVSQLQAEPRGRLRINAPMSFGTLQLAGVVAEFMAAHPALTVELVLNDRLIDPIEEGFDVTVRISEPVARTALVTRILARVRMVLCASPAYLEARGEPAHPGELAAHACLHYGYREAGNQWRLEGADGRHSVTVRCALWSNNGEVLREAALRGLGIALLPTFIVGAELESGRLRALLPGYRPPDAALSALYPRHRHLSAKVRLFVETLAERFAHAQV